MPGVRVSAQAVDEHAVQQRQCHLRAEDVQGGGEDFRIPRGTPCPPGVGGLNGCPYCGGVEQFPVVGEQDRAIRVRLG